MFSPSQHFARATGAMIDTGSAFYTKGIHALFDAGMHAAEQQADLLRTFFASATVATRQWFGPGALDWASPVMHYPSQGGIAQDQAIGMALASVSSPELAVDNGGTAR